MSGEDGGTEGVSWVLLSPRMYEPVPRDVPISPFQVTIVILCVDVRMELTVPIGDNRIVQQKRLRKSA